MRGDSLGQGEIAPNPGGHLEEHIHPLQRQKDSQGAIEWSPAAGSKGLAGVRKPLNFSVRATIGLHLCACADWPLS